VPPGEDQIPKQHQGGKRGGWTHGHPKIDEKRSGTKDPFGPEEGAVRRTGSDKHRTTDTEGQKSDSKKKRDRGEGRQGGSGVLGVWGGKGPPH